MITIKPIEPDAVSLFNKDKFTGDVQGYVMSDGKETLGFSLFRIENNITLLLDVQAGEPALFDGIVRASIAKGETEGASAFAFLQNTQWVQKWLTAYLPNEQAPIQNVKLFGSSCGS